MADNKQCPSFFSATHINRHLRPNIISLGMNAIINTNISGFLGVSPLTSLLRNKISLSAFHQGGHKFGWFITNNPENDDRDGTATAYVETDMSGNVCGHAHYGFSENLQAKMWGQRASSSSLSGANVTGLMRWANHGYNAQVAARLNACNATGTSDLTLVVEQVFRLSQNWFAGGQTMFDLSGGRHCKTPSKRLSAFLSDKPVVDCISMLRWEDGEWTTVTGTMNMSFDAVLRYNRRFSDKLSVGAELSFGRNSVKSTWMHRIELEDGLIMKGQLDTEGTVVGNITKKILPHITVGISTSLNHMSNIFGVGLEVIVGPTPHDGKQHDYVL